MTPDLDTLTALPDAPPPSHEARERAIGRALGRFDARHPAAAGRLHARPFGGARGWAPAFATALVLVLAVPAGWVVWTSTDPTGAPRPTPPQSEPPRPTDPQAASSPPAAGPVAAAPTPSPPGPALRSLDGPAAPPPPSPAAKLADGRLRAEAPLAARPQTAQAPARHAPPLPAAPVVGEAGRAPAEPIGRDQFANAPQAGFRSTLEAPVSTFSIDVDTASYSLVRAALARNALPPAMAVRTEELINYFPYAYPAPTNAEQPFRTTVSVFPSPWAPGRKILKVGIRGYAVQPAVRPRANLVFLIDTSGSMNGPNRLPLVKQALGMLLGQLDARDRVAIVAYAGSAGTVLEPTSAGEKAKILAALEGLSAGGSTAGGEGIRLAYALAEMNLDPDAVNRVVLATDGDFNVGITDRDELKGFVERKRGRGIFLSVLGFGMGNHNDALMQALAQNGNGTAAYIDTLNEARKVMVEEATSTLIPIAKDVKIQVEFNPAVVAEYRLIGYETRLLATEDFANDAVDAGEVGSGQTVTALYEFVPVGGPRLVGERRYGEPARPSGANTDEYAFVKIRYKLPKADTSTQMATPVTRAAEHAEFDAAPEDARFATAVAAFGEILRGSRYTGRFGYDDVLRIATRARGEDPYGYRAEFLQLVRAARTAEAMRSAR